MFVPDLNEKAKDKHGFKTVLYQNKCKLEGMCNIVSGLGYQSPRGENGNSGNILIMHLSIINLS
jgi:hypothetical protein